jgi:hypothetical protein
MLFIFRSNMEAVDANNINFRSDFIQCTTYIPINVTRNFQNAIVVAHVKHDLPALLRLFPWNVITNIYVHRIVISICVRRDVEVFYELITFSSLPFLWFNMKFLLIQLISRAPETVSLYE